MRSRSPGRRVSRFGGTANSKIINYIHGGVGGSGGDGRGYGTGGDGGAGAGPHLHYDIRARQVAVHQYGADKGIHMLHRAVALEASYDSAESFPQPKCHPETRKELLDDLHRWAVDPHSDCSIQWLHGPAGAGKSAVMQTLCRRLEADRKLGGSFFFKRGHASRGNAKVLFATLAYQLALNRHELKGPISQSVEAAPSVLARGMEVQLRTLILEPYKSLQGTATTVLLIDGLDECDGRDAQNQILRLIGSTTADNSFPLRIILSSRPEPHIRESFASFPGRFDSTDIEKSFDDVRTFLCAEFARIHRDHHAMRNIPTPWPAPKVLEMLVEKSSGYFIYASTVIKFIDDEYSRPFERLDVVRDLVPGRGSESPFQMVDQLYLEILSGVPRRHHSSLCDILAVVIHYPQALNAEAIEELVSLEPDDVSLILRPLHSVINLTAERRGEIVFHHASFRDFLTNQERSSTFWVGSPRYQAKVAAAILKALAYNHDDREKNWINLQFRWDPECWIRYIASVLPSTDLVPLIGLINPDFVFCTHLNDRLIEQFLLWLKKLRPVPDDLIQRWEDYRFMHLYQGVQVRVRFDLLKKYDEMPSKRTSEQLLAPKLQTMSALEARMTSEFQTVLAACRKLLFGSPRLVRIFQARRLLDPYGDLSIPWFQIRILLDLSWDVIQQCLCSLRPLVAWKAHCYALFSFLPAICHQLDVLCPAPLVSEDLARGLIRLMQQIENADLPIQFWTPGLQWGRLIRSSPQSSSGLLQELHLFFPSWSTSWGEPEFLEIYDVVRWLKKNPYARPDLVERWKGYVTEIEGRNWWAERREFEERWKTNLEMEAYFHRPLTEFDEEVIRRWQRSLWDLSGRLRHTLFFYRKPPMLDQPWQAYCSI